MSERDIAKAREIYEEIVDKWSYSFVDEESGEQLFRPNNFEEIKFTEKKLAEFDKLNIEDEEILQSYQTIREVINDKEQIAFDLYGQIIDSWDYSEQDPETGEKYYHPTSMEQIGFGNAKIKEFKKLNVENQEINDMFASIGNIINVAPKRRFSGSIWMMIIIGIFVAFSVWSNVGRFIKKVGGYYKIENAQSIYDKQVKYYQGRISYYQKQPDTNKYKAKRIKQYEKDLKDLEDTSPEKYVKRLNTKYRFSSIKNLWNAIFLLLLYAGYYYASRAPEYLINRRQKERELMKKSSSFAKKLIFGTLASAWSTPITTFTTHWSDGSKTRDNDALILLFFNVVVTILILGFVFYVMMVALPFLVIINYLRNYQFEKIQIVLDKINSKF